MHTPGQHATYQVPLQEVPFRPCAKPEFQVTFDANHPKFPETPFTHQAIDENLVRIKVPIVPGLLCDIAQLLPFVLNSHRHQKLGARMLQTDGDRWSCFEHCRDTIGK